MTPPIKMLELKNKEYTGSEDPVDGNLIEPMNEVKMI